MLFRPVLAVILALAGSTFAAEPEQADYFPMNAGDEHTMAVMLTYPDGHTDKSIAHRKIDAEPEKAFVVRGGKRYFRLHTWMEGGPNAVKHTRLVRKDEQGLHSIAEGSVRASEQLEVPMPIKVGNAWKFQEGGMVFTATVVGIETVTIGDRTFTDCYHIRSETVGGSFREDFWEAPKVGTVKSDIVYSNGMKVALTLRNYQPGK